MSDATTVTEPACWIGCLACYNAGRLIGRWYPATEAGEVDLASVHEGSGVHWWREGCEELWSFDIENMPVSREMDPMEASRWGEIYEEVGAELWPAVCAWVRNGAYVAEGDTDYPVLSDFEEAFCGQWPSFRDYAEELASDLGLLKDVPEDLRSFFDMNRWADEIETDYSVEDGPDYSVFIFRSL